jgi:hypothetical protein
MASQPEVIEMASARRIAVQEMCSLREEYLPTVIDDAKRLYLRTVRMISCRPGRWGRRTPVRTKAVRLSKRHSKQAEAATLIWKISFIVEAISTTSDRPARVRSFIERANRLDKAGHRNAAMDLVFDRIDELMRNSQFTLLDSILGSVSIGDMSVDVLLGILTATLPARGQLALRPAFFKATDGELRRRGEYEDGLLTGLE